MIKLTLPVRRFWLRPNKSRKNAVSLNKTLSPFGVFKAFAPKHYTQELFDKILADTKSKLIETELARIVSAIDR